MMRITKEQLARNLDRAIGAEVGLEGLNKLIYGWLNYRKYGNKYRNKLYNRDWMYMTEIMDLSDYAGYDLTKISFC